MCLLYAATHPERTNALILANTFASLMEVDDHPGPMTKERLAGFLEAIEEAWGTGFSARIFTPSSEADDEVVRAWARLERNSVSPRGARNLFALYEDTDARHVLSAISVPTLVVHARGDRACPVTWRGEEIDTAGDGFFAAFDGPARAIRCACAIRDALSQRDVPVRVGLHTGECELIGGKPGGVAVHTGARVASQAQPNEVLVSRTVKDLVAGSGLHFESRGRRELKGLPGTWELFAAEV